MKRYAIVIERSALLEFLPQDHNMNFQLRVVFELVQQNPLPTQGVRARQLPQPFRHVRQPLDREIRNPADGQRTGRHQAVGKRGLWIRYKMNAACVGLAPAKGPTTFETACQSRGPRIVAGTPSPKLTACASL